MFLRMMKLIRAGRRNNADYAGEHYEVAKVQPFFLPSMLIGKLHEEAEEVRDSLNEPEEYGDVLQVLYDLGRLHGVTPEMMEYSRLKKLAKDGDFVSDPAVCYRWGKQ